MSTPPAALSLSTKAKRDLKLLRQFVLILRAAPVWLQCLWPPATFFLSFFFLWELLSLSTSAAASFSASIYRCCSLSRLSLLPSPSAAVALTVALAAAPLDAEALSA